MFKPEVRNFIPELSIVGDEFCLPYLVNLIVKKKSGLSTVRINVLDDDNVTLLRVEGEIWQLKKKRTMYDATGLPLITIHKKAAISWHQQWIVYRGESLNSSTLLYTVQSSQNRSFQLKTRLEVFLASNDSAVVCDFRVVGSYFSQSFKVYKGETLIAEVKERTKFGSIGRERFEVRVYPGIDYSFIVSLLVVLNEIEF